MANHVGLVDHYLNFDALSQLKRQSQKQETSDAALDAVARQFESLFLQQMLKSARDAKLADGMFQSDQSDYYHNLYDKQLSLDLTKSNSLGLAELIKQQLEFQNPVKGEE